jgi:hypothetical protein
MAGRVNMAIPYYVHTDVLTNSSEVATQTLDCLLSEKYSKTSAMQAAVVVTYPIV